MTDDAARARQRRYREKNREALRTKGREYASRPDVRERFRQRYEANRETRLEQMRLRYRAQMEANPEAVREEGRRNYERHGEAVRARVRKRAAAIRAQVFGHYGTSCACCGSTTALSIDHINGGGREHRQAIFGRQGSGVEFYHWLIAQGFPDGYQTLCRRCNISKGNDRAGCRLKHA